MPILAWLLRALALIGLLTALASPLIPAARGQDAQAPAPAQVAGDSPRRPLLFRWFSLEVDIGSGSLWYTQPSPAHLDHSASGQSILITASADVFLFDRIGVGMRYLGGFDPDPMFDRMFEALSFGLAEPSDTYSGFTAKMGTAHLRPWISDDRRTRITLTGGSGTMEYELFQLGETHSEGPNDPDRRASTDGEVRMAEISWDRITDDHVGIRVAIGGLEADLEPIDTTVLDEPPSISGTLPPLDADFSGRYLTISLHATF